MANPELFTETVSTSTADHLNRSGKIDLFPPEGKKHWFTEIKNARRTASHFFSV